jgi:hypothetical protein
VLQVDFDNEAAIHLYRQLGFVEERTWTTWRRSWHDRSPVMPLHTPMPGISRRKRRDIAAEYELAKHLRPPDRGGLGWLRPLHPTFFQLPVRKRLMNWLTLHSTDRLVIRDQGRLAAALWLERQLGAGGVYLTLLVAPLYQGLYNEALLNAAVRRYGGSENLLIEHPADDEDAALLFRRYRFEPRRTLTHMRWET